MRYLRRPAIIVLTALAALVGGQATEIEAATFTDSLQTGSLDPAKWEPWEDAFGSIEPLEDGVHTTILSNTYAESYRELTLFECAVIGDYDAIIDFELLNWPAAGQMGISLAQDFVVNNMRLVEYGQQLYAVSIKASIQATATTDTVGSLRLNRTGTVVTAYYWDTSVGWVALHSSDDPDFTGRGYIYFIMWGHWATTGAEAVWSNFSITADTLNCPDGSQPFTPTWAVTGDNTDANDLTIVPVGDTCLVGLPCKIAMRPQVPAGQSLFGGTFPTEIPAERALEVKWGPDISVGTAIGQFNMSIGSDLGSSNTCDTPLNVSLAMVNAAIPLRFGGGPDGTGANLDRGRADLWPIQLEWQPQMRYWLSQGAEVWARYQAIWDNIGGTGSIAAINFVWLRLPGQGWLVVTWADRLVSSTGWWMFCTPSDLTANYLGETQDSSTTLVRCIKQGTHNFDLPVTSRWSGESVTLSDSLTCQLPDFTDDDGDSIENAIDGRYVSGSLVDESLTYSDDFTDEHLGGTTYGTVVSRGGVQLQVLDEADPRGVRLKAEGTGQAAEVNVCGDRLMYLEGGNQVVVTCGSTEVIVTQGDPVTVVLGTMTAELPADSFVAITETGSNTFAVESPNQSWEPVVVGGVVLEPGESAALADTDNDGLADVADNCPTTANADQANQDGDQWGDACETADCIAVATIWMTPPGDSDCDMFTTAQENFYGTDPNVACALTTGQSDELLPDNWPLDFNDDQLVTTADVGYYVAVLNAVKPDPLYATRNDLNQDSMITTADVGYFVWPLNKSCGP